MSNAYASGNVHRGRRRQVTRVISPRYRPPIVRAAIVVGLLLAPRPLVASPGDTAFLAATQAAMTTMMDAMHVTSSGDADRDFVATMVPHHRGAVEMAEAELRYGRNPQLTRIAQEITDAAARDRRDASRPRTAARAAGAGAR